MEPQPVVQAVAPPGPARKGPVVKAFMQNIYYDQYFTDSVLSAYFRAFYDGYNMQDYAFAEECQDSGEKLMNQLHEFNLNMTRKKDNVDPYYLTTHIMGNEINDSWFYCYQFGDDIADVYKTKAENFVDFGDVYLSFIFNLLSNSLNIKISTENMIEARQDHDSVKFIKNLGQILRACFDFNSYQTVAGSLRTLATNPQDFLKDYVPRVPEPTKAERMRKRKQQMEEARKISDAKKEHDRKVLEEKYGHKSKKGRMGSAINESPVVELREGYKWTALDYIQSPFAFAIGALHALPDESFAYKCSKNLTESRTDLLQAFGQFELKNRLEGVTYLHDSFSLIDEIGLHCHLGIVTELDKPHWDSLFGSEWLTGIPVNLLYNAGAMWVDGVNYWFYNPSTVPGIGENGDWAFFATYLLGDFCMRFFYRDETPNHARYRRDDTTD